MQEEVLRVLKMIEDGKIDAEKGAMLIDALKNNSLDSEEKFDVEEVTVESKVINSEELIPYVNNQCKSFDEKMLYVKVDSHDGDRVNVQLPMSFVKKVIEATGSIPIRAEGIDTKIDMEMLKSAIMNDISGKLVDIESHDGDKVLVIIE